MRDGGLLVPQLTPNLENISKIDMTSSLALVMQKYHANLDFNQMENGSSTAASVKATRGVP